jgi:predicted alpha/beta superfamily hydrolase
MSWGISDYLDESGLEGIDCAEGLQRLDEYGPWVTTAMNEMLTEERKSIGGEGREYIDYLVHELKPMIDQKYRTKPEETSMAGSSMGGLIYTYAACIYPRIFKRIASVSSAYWFNQKQLEDWIKISDLTGIERFYLDIGTKESDKESDNQIILHHSQTIYDLLKTKMENCEFEIIEGAVHNEVAWRERVPAIFSYLYK